MVYFDTSAVVPPPLPSAFRIKLFIRHRLSLWGCSVPPGLYASSHSPAIRCFAQLFPSTEVTAVETHLSSLRLKGGQRQDLCFPRDWNTVQAQLSNGVISRFVPVPMKTKWEVLAKSLFTVPVLTQVSVINLHPPTDYNWCATSVTQD